MVLEKILLGAWKVFRENLIVFWHCQFLSALGKAVIKSLLKFEPVLLRGYTSQHVLAHEFAIILKSQFALKLLLS